MEFTWHRIYGGNQIILKKKKRNKAFGKCSMGNGVPKRFEVVWIVYNQYHKLVEDA